MPSPQTPRHDPAQTIVIPADRTSRRACLVVLAGIVTAAGLGLADEDSRDAEPGQDELDAVVARLNAMETWLNQADEHLASRQRALDAADHRIADHARRVRDLRSQVADLEAVQQRNVAERDRLAAESGRLAALLAGHLRMAWRLSGRDVVKQVLNQESPANADRLMRYHGLLAKARAADLAALKDLHVALTDSNARLADEREALTVAQAALDQGRGTLLDERREQRRLLAGFKSKVLVKKRERDNLAADRERLEALLREVVPRTVLATGARHDQGSLLWPVPGRLVHRFGDSRARGRMRWQGVYLSAPLGTNVIAVASGTVAFADWLRGFGMLAIIDHGDATMSLYGHADTLYKKVGDRVEGGEPIASVGQSGSVTEVGVYFEIRRDGVPVDPQAWLQTRPGAASR